MQDTNFLKNFKSTIILSGQSADNLYTLIRDCSLKGIYSDVRSLICRQGLTKLLILLKLLEIKSISKLVKSDFSSLINFGKDVLYSLKNNSKINWRKHLLNQSYHCIKDIEIDYGSQSADALPCFIVDDTDLLKRGKCIELIGKIFSHVSKGYFIGFKSLNLMYWTGKVGLHLDFSFHGELGKKQNQGISKKQQKNRYNKKRAKDSAGQKRVDQYFKKKTDMAIEMLKRAIRKGFKARYILADSWFFNQQLVRFAIKEKVHLISRPKFNKWLYQYNGKDYTLRQLLNKFKAVKNRKHIRSMAMYAVSVKVQFKGHPIQLFFFKEKKRGTKWRALACTDMRIGAERAYKIYQNRWSIEVSFKELKQYLKYGKCQSQDFDGQIADATHCLMAYNFLAKLKSINQHQSIGALFEEIAHKKMVPTVMQKFWKDFYSIIQKIAKLVETDFEILLEKAFIKDNFFSQLQNIAIYWSTET